MTTIFSFAIGLSMVGAALLGGIALTLWEGKCKKERVSAVAARHAESEANRLSLIERMTAAKAILDTFVADYGRGEGDVESLLSALGEAAAVDRHRREERARL